MSPPPPYSRLDPAERRDQILDTANTLFAERGYEEVSIEEIAKEAGITRGLIHHYFGGRKEVYIALLERLETIREEELRPPRVEARMREWRTRYRAGSIGRRRTGRSTSRRWHPAKASPIPT